MNAQDKIQEAIDNPNHKGYYGPSVLGFPHSTSIDNYYSSKMAQLDTRHLAAWAQSMFKADDMVEIEEGRLARLEAIEAECRALKAAMMDRPVETVLIGGSALKDLMELL